MEMSFRKGGLWGRVHCGELTTWCHGKLFLKPFSLGGGGGHTLEVPLWWWSVGHGCDCCMCCAAHHLGQRRPRWTGAHHEVVHVRKTPVDHLPRPQGAVRVRQQQTCNCGGWWVLMKIGGCTAVGVDRGRPVSSYKDGCTTISVVWRRLVSPYKDRRMYSCPCWQNSWSPFLTLEIFFWPVVVRLKTSEPLSPRLERLSVIRIVLLMTSAWWWLQCVVVTSVVDDCSGGGECNVCWWLMWWGVQCLVATSVVDDCSAWWWV